jgi:hypothetical protein
MQKGSGGNKTCQERRRAAKTQKRRDLPKIPYLRESFLRFSRLFSLVISLRSSFTAGDGSTRSPRLRRALQGGEEMQRVLGAIAAHFH